MERRFSRLNSLIPEQLRIAWCAGFFDSGGSIGLYWTGRQYSLTLRTTCADRNAVMQFRAIVGAGTVTRRPRRDTRNPMFVWFCGARKEVDRILRLFLPFFIVKREQAEEGLDFLSNPDHAEKAYRKLRRSKSKPGRWGRLESGPVRSLPL